MRTVLTALRSAALRTIEENPVDVVAQRREFILSPDGGRVELITSLPPFRGRLIAAKRESRSSVDEAGITKTRPGITLIAPHTITLAWGSAVDVTLTIADVLYQVLDVRVRRYQSEVYAIHASVEEVR